jgi:predicted ATP-dependent endonuclease of OLD family
LVEGTTDRFVLEQVEKYLKGKNEEAGIESNEWSIIEMGGKDRLKHFINLARSLTVPFIGILDNDALMVTQDNIFMNAEPIKVSRIIHDLWELRMLDDNDLATIKSVNSQVSEEETKKSQFVYPTQNFNELIKIANKNDIFVFQKDIEGSMNIVPSKWNKPLKASEKVLDLIQTNSLPGEFYEMSDYIKNKIMMNRP